jgi:predicted ATP-grasp superfamily ATP-dependent carboligase
MRMSANGLAQSGLAGAGRHSQCQPTHAPHKAEVPVSLTAPVCTFPYGSKYQGHRQRIYLTRPRRVCACLPAEGSQMGRTQVRRPASVANPTVSAVESVADGYDVLVLDAATKQSLASVRSFGRAGLRVAVGECFAQCDPARPVVAFRSRYSAKNVVLTSFAADPAAFAAGVLQFVREHPTRVVLPTMDGSIAALTPVREQLAVLGCFLALPSDAVLEIANDKDRTLEIAKGLGIQLPRTVRIDTAEQISAVLDEFEFPIVLKPTISWPRCSGVRLQAVEAINSAEATGAIEALLQAGAGVLVQQWACGRREGVTLFVVDGDIRACCAHVAYRTSPALGGASVMRESLPIPSDIYAAAVNLVSAIGLQGVCEVEFRRDASNRPLLMEINARLAGTIENSVRSGVDFPLMIWQWATGRPLARVEGYETGVRTRWLRGDMRWLRDNYWRVGRPDSVSRSRALWTFGTEFMRTRHYDCVDRHDLGPGIAELHNTVAAIRQSRGVRSQPKTG